MSFIFVKSDDDVTVAVNVDRILWIEPVVEYGPGIPRGQSHVIPDVCLIHFDNKMLRVKQPYEEVISAAGRSLEQRSENTFYTAGGVK